MPTCHRCQRSLEETSGYGRVAVCDGCGFATRCCLNCKHYDPSRYNECSEPVADRVTDKEKSNFCDYFKPGAGRSVLAAARENALKAAEALFKKK